MMAGLRPAPNHSTIATIVHSFPRLWMVRENSDQKAGFPAEAALDALKGTVSSSARGHEFRRDGAASVCETRTELTRTTERGAAAC